MGEVLTYLETLVRETHKPEAEVMTMAFQVGLRQLWRERILGRYLHEEISRDEAVEAVGIDWVGLAERQHEAMMEDLVGAGRARSLFATRAIVELAIEQLHRQSNGG